MEALLTAVGAGWAALVGLPARAAREASLLRALSPPANLLFCVGASYALSAAALLLKGRPVKGAHVPPASYPFVLCGLLMAIAAGVVGGLSQGALVLGPGSQLAPYAYASVGALACVLSVCVHHPSTSLSLVAAAVLLTLADAGGWATALEPGSLTRSILITNGATFTAAYAVSRPSFVSLFGSGATLFSLVSFLPLAAVVAADPAQRATVLSAGVAAATPFALMLTGHPEYLHTQPHWRTLLTSFGGVLAIGVTAASHTSLMPLLLAAALALGTSCMHAYVDATYPPVLGPFYSYERRTAVLSMVCVCLVALQLAAVQDSPVAPVPTSFFATGPGTWATFVQAAAAGPYLSALLLLVLGYAATLLLLACFTLAVASIRPRSSSAYRAAVWDAGLTLVFLTSGAYVVLAYTSLPSTLAAGAATAVRTAGSLAAGAASLAPASLSAPALAAWHAAGVGHALQAWHPAWYVAFACAVGFCLASFLQRALTRSTPLLAPLAADVFSHGSPVSRCAAVTFTGAPDDVATPNLLALLAARGARATFFVTAQTAVKKRLLVQTIAAAGHEVGLLGATLPNAWTPWGAGAAVADGISVLQETLQPVAAAAAHAPEAARAHALLAAIRAESAAAAAAAVTAASTAAVGTGTTGGSGATGSADGAVQLPSAARRRRAGSVTAAAAAAGSDVARPVRGASARRAASAAASAALGESTAVEPAVGAPAPATASHAKPAAAATATTAVAAPAAGTGGGPHPAIGSFPLWYRPQDGSRSVSTLRAVNARGLGVALWNCCPWDWDGSPVQIGARAVAQLDAAAHGPADAHRGASGAVVSLYHSVPSYLEPAKAAHRPAHDVVACARGVLDALAARGVGCVTLSELAGPAGARAGPMELFPT